MNFEAIGIFHGPVSRPYEQPRQGVLSPVQGSIKLNPHNNFEQALIGLEGCQRIWITFVFHKNNTWKPKVSPPRGEGHKLGVFATRSPYRPNPIGLSCVKLEKIKGLELIVSKCDLLDQSPILDIKPYISYADSFPEITPLWIQNAAEYHIEWKERALRQAIWLESHVPLFKNTVENQLLNGPKPNRARRIKAVEGGWCFSLQTWRIFYQISGQLIQIEKIASGYGEHELNLHVDTYKDKNIHQRFCVYFAKN